MMQKTALIELIQQLPSEKIPAAIELLKPLVEKQQENKGAVDPLQDFLSTIVYTMSNALYDLSVDANRKNEKIMSNRLETYRKKVSDGWDVYKRTTDIQ